MNSPTHDEVLQVISFLESRTTWTDEERAYFEPKSALNTLLNYVLHNLDKDRDVEYDDKHALCMKIYELKHRINGS